MLFGPNPKEEEAALPSYVPRPDPVPSRPSAPALTVIAKGVKIDGDFGGEGDMRIDGEVAGKLTVGGLLTVGQEASVKAEVKAATASIAGKVEGNINVTDRIELKSSANIKGDLVAASLAIEPGAKLSGHVSIGEEKGASL